MYASALLNGCQIRGVEYVDKKVKAFLGVPYARPPTGSLRFRKPQPLPLDYRYESKDGGVLDCTDFQSICPQPPYFLNGSTPISAPPPGSRVSEDCLYLNIWMPSSTPAPRHGWPVMAWIHGGWFQVGNPMHDAGANPIDLIAPESVGGAGLECVVVAIGYRLNVFGFLACDEVMGNFGLWDQRAGLEWIHHNIANFNGDPGNVTLAGLSAGANSVHQQLNYEFFESRMNPIVHRAIMYSNSISAQSRTPDRANDQFDELCAAFRISPTLTRAQQVEQLRAIKDSELAGRLMSLKHHTFRHVTDGDFISPDLVKRAQTGEFAAEFKRRGFKLIIGEVENEYRTYRAVNPPSSRRDFLPQLENYYSAETSLSLSQLRPFPQGKDENEPENWKDLFGEIVAAAQVHASERLFISQLLQESTGLTTKDVLRYRISMRLSLFSRAGVPENMGVAHGFCQPIWWFQKRAIFRADEEAAIRAWLKPWKDFVAGRAPEWGTSQMKQYRSLNSDGHIEIKDDEYWTHFEAFHDALMSRTLATAYKL